MRKKKSKSKIETKQIAFNLSDPLQKELYEYVDKFNNFSFYGKMLIRMDMSGKLAVNSARSDNVVEDDSMKISKDVFQSFI